MQITITQQIEALQPNKSEAAALKSALKKASAEGLNSSDSLKIKAGKKEFTGTYQKIQNSVVFNITKAEAYES